MIAKYRNRTLIYLTLASALTVAIAFLVHKNIHTRVSERSSGLIATCRTAMATPIRNTETSALE